VRCQAYALDLGFGEPPQPAAIFDGGKSLCSSRESRVDSFVVELRILVTNVTELGQ
jgi:hypothetical protein